MVPALAAAGVVGTLLIVQGGNAGEPAATATPPTAAATGCASRPVRVAATAEVAPVVRAVAERIGHAPGAACAGYEVREQSPADTVTALVRGGSGAPQVWVADSPLQVASLNAGRQRANPKAAPVTAGTPFAFSPVVLVRPEQAARPPAAAVASWPQAMATLPVTGRDPSRSTATALMLVEVLHEVDLRRAPQAAAAKVLHLASATAAADAEALSPAAVRSGPMFPVSEQQLVSYNASHGSDVGAVMPGGAVLQLQYAVVPIGTDATGREAARRLQAALTDAEGIEALHRAGFRVEGKDRGFGVDGIPDGLNPAATSATLRPAQLSGLQQRLGAAARRMRMLAAIDVSGSMLEPVKGRRTRLDYALAAATGGLRLMGPDTRLGLWAFSTQLGGRRRDHVQIAPIAALRARERGSTHGGQLLAGLPRLRSLVGGDTGLYDTIWYAVQHVRAGYEAGFENSVVVITDGRNDDPAGGLNRTQLIDLLRRSHDPKRPVRVILIGMTKDADARDLASVAAAAGGRSYVARDPAQIGPILVDAVLSRSS